MAGMNFQTRSRVSKDLQLITPAVKYNSRENFRQTAADYLPENFYVPLEPPAKSMV